MDELLHEDPIHEDVEEIFQLWNDELDADEEVRMRLPKRYVRDYQDPFDWYRDHEFEGRYRFSKGVVRYYLLPLIRDHLDRPNNRGLPIAPLLQLTIVLRYYATASFQKVHGDLRGLSQSSICLCIRRVSIAFASLLNQFVKFPESLREQLHNVQEFHRIAGFPGVGTLLDGVLVAIASPGRDIAEIFRCRKGYFAINVMAAVDPRGKFMYFDVRHPGSTHDQTCFDRSGLKLMFEQDRVRGIILADDGYANEPYLLTPYVDPVTVPQRRYNAAHIPTRGLIERNFGRWKRKFPCLKRLLTKLNNSVAIICATAVLWNIYIDLKFPNDVALQNFRLDPQAHVERRDDLSGLDYRDLYTLSFFT
ncbi:hypothetical protein QAD02_022335 [Eretmocerus hayati]|uniref:Uncharacterized protein n=1 Tax=Eretmocerus hayati TaxID=131215 RepID=A0ACC2PSN4_9HYME|nr:hypothetical protein QAD02_022335 [Eretmocerus hayati]